MAWQIRTRVRGIEGYADTVSASPGQRVRLFVSTTSPSYVVRVFRMGWYDGRRGALVRTLPERRGIHQARPVVLRPRNTVVARWRATTVIDTTGLAPGMYLLRLDARNGAQAYIPLTLRAPSAAGAVVLVSPVTTWQAYNTWGCCNLYRGGDGAFATRSRAVSFDRPYAAEHGAGEFIERELPVIAEAERLHLRLDYVTDVDLDRFPHLLAHARAVISMGHDEYWSPRMRANVTVARDHGTNIAFLGANVMFRRIRFERSELGTDRVQVDYKIASEDPMLGKHNNLVTSDWPDPPDPQPESAVTGEPYNCFARVHATGVVVTPLDPLFRGTGVTRGTRLPRMIGPEIDHVTSTEPRSPTLRVLMHSPFPCPGGRSYADATYYTAPSGAVVFDSGTMSWVCGLSGGCAPATTARVLRIVTDNLLRWFAAGPAGKSRIRQSGQ